MPESRPVSAGRYDPNCNLLDWMTQNRVRYGNIYHASIFGGDVYVVSDPEYAEYVLRRNWQNYRKGLAIKRVAMLLGKGLMVSEGELWKRQRRMIQPSFHPTSLPKLEGAVYKANLSLIRRWELAAMKGEDVDVTRDVSGMILEATLRAIFGCDYDRVAPAFNLLSENSVRDLQFAQTFRSLAKIVIDLATERRSEGRTASDLLHALIEARDSEFGQPLPDAQLANEVLTLIVAGHETSAATLNWLWYELSQNPDVERRLRQEVEKGSDVPEIRDLPQYPYARQVIEETLRMYPAGWLMSRRALRDDHIGGFLVPAGTEIYISPYMIQRHPDYWDDPDRFDPDRFNPGQVKKQSQLALLPFSAGPRNCIGEHLARLEMHLHVVMVSRKVRFLYDAKLPLEFELGVNLRSRYNFVMTPVLARVCPPAPSASPMHMHTL